MNSPRFLYGGAVRVTVFIVWGSLSLFGCFVHSDSSVAEPSSAAAVLKTPSASAETSAAADISAASSGSDAGNAGDSEQTSVPEPEKKAKGGILEIKEKMFLTQINDIFYNFESYRNKTVIVEGMYSVLYSWDGSESVSVVYRRGPGCCGNDGWGGFVLKYDGSYPPENAWIRVTGFPELDVAPEGYTTLYLNVIRIEEKNERGAEFVNQ